MTFGPKDADAWYERNKDVLTAEHYDPVMNAIIVSGIKGFDRVFEYGCANGYRLNRFLKEHKSDCWGSELSPLAIRDASPKIKMNLEPAIASCDLVIIGFCLYLVQPESLLYWAHHADAILKDGGHLVIWDFLPDNPHSRIFEHNKDLRSRKMNHAKLWLSHPGYSIVYRKVHNREDDNECTHVSILKKDLANAFPLKDTA